MSDKEHIINIIFILVLLLCIGLVLSSSGVFVNPQEDETNLDENHISYEQSDFNTYQLTYHIDCNGNGEIDVAQSITKLSSLTISDLSEACTYNQQSFDAEDYYVWTDTAFNEGWKY